MKKLKESGVDVKGGAAVITDPKTYQTNKYEFEKDTTIVVPQDKINKIQTAKKANTPYKAPDSPQTDAPKSTVNDNPPPSLEENLTPAAMEPVPAQSVVTSKNNGVPNVKPKKEPTGPGVTLMKKIENKPDIQAQAEKTTQLQQKKFAIEKFMDDMNMNKMQMGQILAALQKKRNQMPTEGVEITDADLLEYVEKHVKSVTPKMKKKDLMELIEKSKKLDVVETIKVKNLLKK